MTPPAEPIHPVSSLRPVEEIAVDLGAMGQPPTVYRRFKIGAEFRRDAVCERLLDDVPALLARLRAAEETLTRVEALVDAIEDEGATRCCNRGPSQPCTDECHREANLLDRFRSVIAAPTRREGCPCGVAAVHGPHESALTEES